MKKKLLCLLLIVSFAIPALTSCLITGNGEMFLPEGTQIGDTTINVEGGPNYDIQINSSSDKSLLAASRALLSAVSVRCGFKTSDGKTGMSAGAGVIYKLDKERGDAYVITNQHVVYNELATSKNGIVDEIYIYLYGMEYAAEGKVSYAIPATYVGGSMNYDIAVLKITGSTVLMESSAVAATVADSDEVSVLETAIAIGNPENCGISATVGYINVDSEEINLKFDKTDGSSARVSIRVMRTDAAVNVGNSGGGLFNDKGELIGIVNAREPDTSINNMSYAIPSNVAKAIADNAIYYGDGTVKRCLLGITVGSAKYWTEYDETTGKVHRREKVVITDFTATSAVKDVMKVGDVINSITIDGVTKEVTRIHHVVDAMLYARVGSTVVTNVTRDGVKMDIPITITQNMLTVY